jgi:hypothetical protein
MAFNDVNRLELLREMGQTDFAGVMLTEPPDSTPGIEKALASRIQIKVARAALVGMCSSSRVIRPAAKLLPWSF